MTNTISLTYVYWNESGDTLYSPAFCECDDFYEWLVSHEEDMRRMDLQRERECVNRTTEPTESAEPKDGGDKKKKKGGRKRGAKNGVAGLASAFAAFILPFISFSK